MTFSILYFSHRGEGTAEKLASALGGNIIRAGRGTLAENIGKCWNGTSVLVLVSSVGVAVRGIAPFLKDKATDPAVIAVTEDGTEIIPLVGAHLAGGSEAAQRIGSVLGRAPLITTSSDRAGFLAPDLLSSRWKWRLKNKEALVHVNSKLMKDGKLHCYVRDGIGPVPLPDYYESTGDTDKADVIIDYGTPSLSAGQVQLVPPCLAAGIGCRKGTPSDGIRNTIDKVLRDNSLAAEAIREIRTIGEKTEEPGLLEAAEKMGIPVIEVSRENILAQKGPFTPSAAEKYFDIPGVAEPCAASAGPLIVPRAACDGVTAAVSLDYRPPRGMLWIVGTGPGDKVYLTYQAGSKLQESDTVIGYRLYVDLLPKEYLNGKRVERYGMGEEEMRVERAVSLAEAGHRVALISGGDPILFGLAALALRHAGNRTEAEVIPGLSAAQVAGSRMGAPYTNGLVMLSLSDYLQPWDRTMKALEGAASMEMTVALYNPVKRDLDEKLAFVRKAFGSHPDREIYLAGNAGRKGEIFRKMKLEDLSPADVDMRTMILIPGKDTEEIGGALMDKRGYTSEGKGGAVPK